MTGFMAMLNAGLKISRLHTSATDEQSLKRAPARASSSLSTKLSARVSPASGYRRQSNHWAIPGALAAGLHVSVLSLAYIATPAPLVAFAPPLEMSVEIPSEIQTQEVARIGESPNLDTKETIESAGATTPSVSHTPSARVPTRRSSLRTTRAASTTDEPATGGEKTANATGEELASTSAASFQNSAAGVATASAPQPSNAVTLMRKPRLLSSGSACQGVFSDATLKGATKVTLVLEVGKDGTASPKAVRASSNAAIAALERAALLCARRLRFSPALTTDGFLAVASASVSLTISKHLSIPSSYPKREGTI